MTKKNSGRGQITARDERIIRNLYWTRLLTTRQIASLHFRSYETCRRRLYSLRYQGLLTNHAFTAEETPYGESRNVWMLTTNGLDYALRDLGKEKERYFKRPANRFIWHYLDTNDVYAMVAGGLDTALGPYPAWDWREEKRASRNWNMGGKERTHRPDAEVRFGDTVYYIERETARAKEPPSHFLERMEGYAGYIRYLRANGVSESFWVMWACDTERDEDHAADAGERFGVPTYAGTPKEVARRLKQHAQESIREDARPTVGAHAWG